jgi:hypothetical protein
MQTLIQISPLPRIRFPFTQQKNQPFTFDILCRLRLKCDGTRAEIRFRLSAKWTSPFKSAGASIHSTTDSRGVRISGNNAGYTMFRGTVKCTGYSLHSPVFPSLPLPCVTTFQLDSTCWLHLVSVCLCTLKPLTTNSCSWLSKYEAQK